jgi:hypothetical protein
MTTNKPYRTIELSVVLNQADREEQTKIINTNIVRWAGFFQFAPRYVEALPNKKKDVDIASLLP